MWLMTWRWFDNIIMALIVLNSICMGAFDYIDEEAPRNVILNQLSDVFSILFTIEAIIKIIALGLVLGKNTYLRDAWNVIDFFIVITALLQFGLEYFGGDFISLKSLRVLRILRPLKGIKTIPSLRKQVAALLRSVYKLVNVSVFLLFIFILFGIMGLQWFSGSIFYACRATEKPIPGELVWEKTPLATEAVCSISGGTNNYNTVSGYQCPTNTWCGTPLDHGLTLEDDGVYDNAAIQFGRASFSNIFDSILAVFQIITNDNWTLIIYNLMNHEGMALPATFGVSLIFLGTWFLLNLMLAVIMGEYIDGEQEQAEFERQQAKEEKEELERRINERPDMTDYSRLNTLIQTRHDRTLKQKMECHFQSKMQQMMSQRMETQLLNQAKTEGLQGDNDHQELDKAILEDQNTTPKPDSMKEASFPIAGQVLESPENDKKCNNTLSQLIMMNRPDRQNDKLINPIDLTGDKDLDEMSQDKKDDLELNALEALNILKLNSTGKDDNSADFSKEMKKSNLMSRIQSGIAVKVDKHLDELNHLDRRVKTVNNPEAQSLLTGIHSRVIAAVNLENLEDKITAVNQIRAEKNLMLMRFEAVLAEKYQDTHQQMYGFKDEEQTMKIMKSNIHSMLSNYTKNNSNSNESPAKKINPLAAVFALRMQEEKKTSHRINDHDKDIEAGMRSGKLRSKSQMKLVMEVKQQFELEMKQKELMKRLGSAFKTIAEERASMEDIADEYDDLLDLGINETRAQQNKCYQWSLDFSQSKFFNIIISVTILANTVVLAMDQHPDEPERIIRFKQANIVFYFVFLFEMIIRQTATGFKMYFRDEFNTFDFIVIIISTIDILLQSVAESNMTGYDAIQALRVFRLLRVFKLAKVWPEFNYILKTVFTTLKKVAPFSLLVLIVAFSYTILGLETFSRQLSFDSEGKPVPNDYDNGPDNMKGIIPDWNFNNFYDAFICVFIVIANDGWAPIYYDHFRSMSWFKPTFFFVSLIIIGQFILFQLFLAILLQEFNERSIVEAATVKIHEQQNKKTQTQHIKEWIVTKLRKCCPCCFNNIKEIDGENSNAEENKSPKLENSEEKSRSPWQNAEQMLVLKDKNDGEDSNNHEPDGQQGGGSEQNESDNSNKNGEASDDDPDPNDISIYIFKTNNKLRKFMMKISKAKAFENLIILLIILSSIQLTLENPLIDPLGTEAHVLRYCDLVMTILFTFEVVFKVIAHGFLINGKDSYLQNPWNILDFIIVVISLVSVSIPEGQSESLATFKVIRMARLLRPIRVISKNDGLKISIQALYVSVPAILNLLVIVLLFMVIFGIVGVNLFKGKFEYCDVQSSEVMHLSQKQLYAVILDNFDCYNYGGTWSKHVTAFDNIGESFEQMIAQACTVGWASVMYKAMNSNGINRQPGSKENYGISLFFCAYIIFGAYFMANLFVGVVISSFNRESEKLGKHFLLTDEQKKWIETKLLVTRINPKYANKRPQHWIRAKVFDIVEHIYFEYFILVCICLNTLVLAVYGIDVPDKYIEWTENANIAFSIIFLVEAIVKLLAFGSRYFRDYWNIFDFVIVVGSLIFIVLKYGFKIELFSAATQVIRALRIGRILKLFRKLNQLQIIFRTFLTTLPALMNVGCLMFLIQYIFAVIGMNLFAKIKVKAPMHRWLNFQTVPNSLLTLLRVSTGENWNDLMYALGEGHSISNQCIDNPSFEDYRLAGNKPMACGYSWLSNFYFYFYILLVSMIFLNIFIAIILQGYFQTQEMELQELNSTILEDFREAWSKFDPDATGFIDIKDFPDLMFALGKPLGWPDSYRDKKSKQSLFYKLISLNLETYHSQRRLFFPDVLDNITLFYVIRKEVKGEMNDQGIEMDSDDEDDNDSSYEYGEEESESERSEQHSGGGGSDSDNDGRPPKRKKRDSDSNSSSELGIKEEVNWVDPKEAIVEVMQSNAAASGENSSIGIVSQPNISVNVLGFEADANKRNDSKTKIKQARRESSMATALVTNVPSAARPSSSQSSSSQLRQEYDDYSSKPSTKIDLKARRATKKKKIQPQEHAYPQYDALLEKAMIDKRLAEQNTNVNIVRDLQKKNEKHRKKSKRFEKDSDQIDLAEVFSLKNTVSDSNSVADGNIPKKLRKDSQSQIAVRTQTHNNIASKQQLKTAASIVTNPTEHIADDTSGNQSASAQKRLQKKSQSVSGGDKDSESAKTHSSRVKTHKSLKVSQDIMNSLNEDDSSIDSKEDTREIRGKGESLEKLTNDIESLSYGAKSSLVRVKDQKNNVEMIKEEDELVEEEISRMQESSKLTGKTQTAELTAIGQIYGASTLQNQGNRPAQQMNTKHSSSQKQTQMNISMGSSALIDAELSLEEEKTQGKRDQLNDKNLQNILVVNNAQSQPNLNMLIDEQRVSKNMKNQKLSSLVQDVHFESD